MSSQLKFAGETAVKVDTTSNSRASTRWWMLGLLCWIMALGGMAQYATAPLSPLIIDALGLTKAQFGILSSAVVFATILTTLIASIITSRIGVGQSLLWGTVIMGAALIFFFLPQSFWLAFLLLFLSGIGYSAITPATNDGVVEWFPATESGFALGLKQTGMPMGVALNAAVLPIIAAAYGWEAAIGWLGVFIVVAGVGSYMFYRPGPYRAPAVKSAAGQPSGWEQLRILLQDPGIRWLAVVGFSLAGTQASIITFMVTFVQEMTALSNAQAAAFLVVSQVAGGISRPIIGFISDRAFSGRRQISLAVTAASITVAVIAFSFIGPGTPRWLLVAIVAAVGGLTMGWIGPVFAMVIQRAGPALSGVASGLSVTTNMTGVMLTPPLFGYVADLFSFQTALLISAGWVGVVGILFAVLFSDSYGGTTPAGGTQA